METLQLTMAGGQASAALFRPEVPAGAAVILYMDIFGPRPSLWQMAARFAGMGYLTLVPDLFWRFGAYGPFDPATAWGDPAKAGALRGMAGATTQAMTMADTGVFLDRLAAEGADRVAAVGYCMGGARALNAASAHPGRILAAASFHGGNLASEAADSPAARAALIKARVHVGSAGVDSSFPPEQAGRLAQALRAAEVDHVMENYTGCAHGWCVPDHAVFHSAGALRHWRRLEVFLGESLAG